MVYLVDLKKVFDLSDHQSRVLWSKREHPRLIQKLLENSCIESRKSLYSSLEVQLAGAYPGFLSNSPLPILLGGERHDVSKVSCPRKQIDPARSRTRTIALTFVTHPFLICLPYVLFVFSLFDLL